MTKDATYDRATANGAGRKDDSASSTRAAEVGDALRAAGSGIGDAVGAARTAVPELARTSQGVATDFMRRVEAGSDQQVLAGVALSLGLAIGMLLGSAPRILIAAALVPVAAMGLVLMDRRQGRGAGSAAGRTA